MGLHSSGDGVILFQLSRTALALLAQLDRVFDYESKGRGFESLRARHKKNLILQRIQGFLF